MLLGHVIIIYIIIYQTNDLYVTNTETKKTETQIDEDKLQTFTHRNKCVFYRKCVCMCVSERVCVKI